MFKEVLQHAHMTIGPSLALILFFTVMCGAIVWVYRKGANEFYFKMAHLPLNGDNNKEIIIDGR